MTENILISEEDIRGKILLPYLENLGFDGSEIALENHLLYGWAKHSVSSVADQTFYAQGTGKTFL